MRNSQRKRQAPGIRRLSFFSTALIAADGTFTYKEFDTITARVANALIRRGAKVGGRALILLPRTSRALFAFYGASKAGLRCFACYNRNLTGRRYCRGCVWRGIVWHQYVDV
ncbi:MAG: long-chain fatty acid--CoA ligase [Selenomonas ruminantium]|nr:long-chain fatty acid--CoA ligase [Selenomonas ruminantium]